VITKTMFCQLLRGSSWVAYLKFEALNAIQGAHCGKPLNAISAFHFNSLQQWAPWMAFKASNWRAKMCGTLFFYMWKATLFCCCFVSFQSIDEKGTCLKRLCIIW
jgi:hypothetical protein